jgi:hypothetical protein
VQEENSSDSGGYCLPLFFTQMVIEQMQLPSTPVNKGRQGDATPLILIGTHFVKSINGATLHPSLLSTRKGALANGMPFRHAVFL